MMKEIIILVFSNEHDDEVQKFLSDTFQISSKKISGAFTKYCFKYIFNLSKLEYYEMIIELRDIITKERIIIIGEYGILEITKERSRYESVIFKNRNRFKLKIKNRGIL